jgi:large subunit ribosomal protein L30
MAGNLRVTLRKSVVSTTQRARGTVRALGLHRIGETVEVPDNPATRGMVRAVRYLVTLEEVPAAQSTRARKSGPSASADTTVDAPQTTAAAEPVGDGGAAPAAVTPAARTRRARSTTESKS